MHTGGEAQKTQETLPFWARTGLFFLDSERKKICALMDPASDGDRGGREEASSALSLSPSLSLKDEL